MRHRGHISEKDRQNRSRLAKLVHNRRLLMGSLVTMTRTCGNPRCKCPREKACFVIFVRPHGQQAKDDLHPTKVGKDHLFLGRDLPGNETINR